LTKNRAEKRQAWQSKFTVCEWSPTGNVKQSMVEDLCGPGDLLWASSERAKVRRNVKVAMIKMRKWHLRN